MTNPINKEDFKPDLTIALEGGENPHNWSAFRKFKSAFVAILIKFVSAFNATGNSAAKSGVTKEFNISSSVFLTSSFTVSFFIYKNFHLTNQIFFQNFYNNHKKTE